MIRLTHFRCRAELAAVDAEAEALSAEAQRLVGDIELRDRLDEARRTDVEALIAERDALDAALAESQRETQELRARVSEEQCPENRGHSISLGLQVDELERQVEELEAELETWREHAGQLSRELTAHEQAESVLEARRRRVAADALDDAAERPAHPQSAHQATVAAAIAAMPLAYFDPEVACDVGYDRARWLVDGQAVDPYGTPERARDQIAARYGFTDAELDAIEASARAQAVAEAEAEAA